MCSLVLRPFFDREEEKRPGIVSKPDRSPCSIYVLSGYTHRGRVWETAYTVLDPDYATFTDVTRWPRRACAHTMPKAKPVGHLRELWTFSMIELAFVKYLGLVNLSNEADLVTQTFKYVTSYVFCNLISPPRYWRTDPIRYRQSPRPSVSVFILKELKCCGGERSGFETRLIWPINILYTI